ncbi:MAG: nucleotidyltransferase domain-containing protein [Chloroflexi bacterium]|nr:nucleotidyltransferase domain-containing protein [Chloroflexota bacterium]
MSIAELSIEIDGEKIAGFCRARGIRKLSLFGSVLREDFDPQRSDVDVLAEFEPGALRDSSWDYFLYGEQLGELMGHKVDFCTHLRPWLRPLVEKHALTIYDESAS